MVDGGTLNGAGSSPKAISGEFYVQGYGARMNLSEAPIQALSRKSKEHLAQLLNGTKILPSEEVGISV